MTNIRRYFNKGQVCFLTHVTHDRLPILIEHSDLLWRAIHEVQDNSHLKILAWVVLPDNPVEWKHSSFRMFRDRGLYSDDWGVINDPTDGVLIGE